MDNQRDSRLPAPDDLAILSASGTDIFDNPVTSDAARAFLTEPGHGIVGTLQAGRLVGLARGTATFYPDKAAQVCVNEVGVAADGQRRGTARRILPHRRKSAQGLGRSQLRVASSASRAAACARFGPRAATETPDLVMYHRDGPPNAG